jgi:diguanylate cyclase (GGDEF)-like protein
MHDKILVVDDNPNNVRLLVDILEDEGYEIHTLNSGLQVVEMARNLKPDVILLDIMMPEMDGFEVCKSLKEDPDLKDISVIMVTAKVESKDLKNALEMGAEDYIKKPIDEVEVIARLQSVLRQKHSREDLKDRASKDSLTSLYNHALLLELFDKEMNNLERSKSEISFVMIDIDFFKKINDTYGHTVGDIVLKELSKLLMEGTRSGDFLGRYGGEEFGIVLPRISKENTSLLCERLRDKIEKHEILIGDKVIKITVSIGYYHKVIEDHISSEDMVKYADEALYKAKQNGRNRVESWKISS